VLAMGAHKDAIVAAVTKERWCGFKTKRHLPGFCCAQDESSHGSAERHSGFDGQWSVDSKARTDVGAACEKRHDGSRGSGRGGEAREKRNEGVANCETRGEERQHHQGDSVDGKNVFARSVLGLQVFYRSAEKGRRCAQAAGHSGRAAGAVGETCGLGCSHFKSKKQVLFGNLSDIYDVHKRLLSKFDQRVKANPQPNLADLFSTFADSVVALYRPYYDSYPKAIALIALKEKKTKVCLLFVAFFLSFFLLFLVQGFRQLCTDLTKKIVRGGMSLENYLIMPIQRLPRYAMLLRELEKVSSSSFSFSPLISRQGDGGGASREGRAGSRRRQAGGQARRARRARAQGETTASLCLVSPTLSLSSRTRPRPL
jgi:hypothetical protein